MYEILFCHVQLYNHCQQKLIEAVACPFLIDILFYVFKRDPTSSLQ
jgi:hypothetical protein